MSISKEERILLALLKKSLTGKTEGKAGINCSGEVWHRVLLAADRNAVLPLIFDGIAPYTGRMKEEDRKFLSDRTLVCVRQYYYLNYLTANALRVLREADIPAVVLKGTGAASFYPHPAYRKSGDIDIFLARQGGYDGTPEGLFKQTERAASALKNLGFSKSVRQTTTYHISFEHAGGVELELHTFLSEPFENEALNQAIRNIQRDGSLGIKRIRSEGETLYVPDDAGMAFSLLVHMLHHFMRSGFGLKLLADWTVFWNTHKKSDDPVKSEYENLVGRCGLTGFSEAVTGVCARYLGLESPGLSASEDAQLCEDFLRDILESGEFGEDDTSRTVALSGSSIRDYLAEFHHRMKLNFPKASSYPVLYPVLWIRTLFRFLRNNKKIRHVKLGDVLEKAGMRGDLSRRLKH